MAKKSRFEPCDQIPNKRLTLLPNNHPTMKETSRCPWCTSHELYIAYHDLEWGVPCHDDQQLFEMLCLEGAQAGLSWFTILQKRENYRRAFDQFDAEKMALYDEAKRNALLNDAGIVRNRLKVNAFIENAKAYLKVRERFGSFDHYIWQFVGHQPIVNQWQRLGEVPASTPESDAMCKDLKKQGFKFVGSTICYAFMQATGMVDDHLVGCWKRA